MTVVRFETVLVGLRCRIRGICQQDRLTRFLMPIIEMFDRMAKILKGEHIDIGQSGFHDLRGDMPIGLVAVSENQVMLVVSSDGIMRGLVIELGQFGQLLATGLRLE